MGKELKFILNGERCEVVIEPNCSLLDVLRNVFGLVGAKEGCGRAECGACTVLVDGKPVRSCITLAVECEGKEIETIEGLSESGNLHPLQRAFIDHRGFQCGFCTPGMILTAKALLQRGTPVTRTEVKEAISGNLCRCTGYDNIVDSVMSASETMQKERGR